MLWKFRILLFYFVISIITISFYFTVFLPITLTLRILSITCDFEDKAYDLRYKIAVVFSQIFIWITKVIVGLNYKVEGLEKLPKVPSLVLSNHQSFWENVFMQLIIPKHTWVMKKELFNIPFFGWGLKEMRPIAVDRSQNHSILQIINGGKEKFLLDHWVIMFPEATRLKVNQSTKFKASAAKLALEANVPIVLIAHDAGLYWPKGFWITKGTIQVKIIDILRPDQIKHHDSRSLTDYIQNIINTEKEALINNNNRNL
jgi:1-acyl-sn-glycerol-3-phosphate acyltransferase